LEGVHLKTLGWGVQLTRLNWAPAAFGCGRKNLSGTFSFPPVCDGEGDCPGDKAQLPRGISCGYRHLSIGAGLAGGDWEIISSIINEELEGEDHTCVVLPS